jgi:hypothetical protein
MSVVTPLGGAAVMELGAGHWVHCVDENLNFIEGKLANVRTGQTSSKETLLITCYNKFVRLLILISSKKKK